MTDTQLEEINVYLEQHGYDCIPVHNPNGGFMFIDVIIKKKTMRLKCVFPQSFPYSFPKIYILTEFYKSMAPLPHIDDNGFICTYDSNVSFPNFEKPHELVCESIDKAIGIIEDGLNGINRDDFIEEFNAYWSIEAADKISACMLSSLDDKPQILSSHKDDDSNFYIGNNENQLMEYLKYSKGLDIKSVDIDRCLYLPLKKGWYPPFPQTDREVYLKVREDAESFEAYNKYLRNRTKRSMVIFSQSINNGISLAGWIHQPVKTPNGFRKGKIVPGVAYLCQNKNRKIIKLDINQLDRRRLFNRGGDGKAIPECKVSVTGCGSIGSYLIQVLAELGLDDFRIIDSEALTSENIARHMCGASEIGKFKTEAIKEQLIKHYPYLQCQALAKNVFDVFGDDIGVFNSCDVNFVVVGDKPTEARFIELFNQNIINKPIVIIWVEPFMLGGHSIILQEVQDIKSLLYDEEYKFRYKVLSDGGKYAKKEAGCQSTFIPYSAFEAQQFVFSFIDYYYDNFIQKKTAGNHLFSWCGKLDWARKNDIEITDIWLAKSNRSKSIKRLDEK